MNCEERCEDRHASACLVCGDGGDLLCCDACPNAVHPTCVSLETVPEVRQARTSCSYEQTSRPCCPYISACCHVSCSECSVARASGNLAEALPFQPSWGPDFGRAGVEVKTWSDPPCQFWQDAHAGRMVLPGMCRARSPAKGEAGQPAQAAQGQGAQERQRLWQERRAQEGQRHRQEERPVPGPCKIPAGNWYESTGPRESFSQRYELMCLLMLKTSAVRQADAKQSSALAVAG